VTEERDTTNDAVLFPVAFCYHCGRAIGMGDCVTRTAVEWRPEYPQWLPAQYTLHRCCEEPWSVLRDIKEALR